MKIMKISELFMPIKSHLFHHVKLSVLTLVSTPSRTETQSLNAEYLGLVVLSPLDLI